MNPQLKLRLSVAAIGNGVVLYSYCQTGQTIVDEVFIILTKIAKPVNHLSRNQILERLYFLVFFYRNNFSYYF
jgi:hypothetical protein